MPNNRFYSERLCCSKDTKQLILDKCGKEFLKHHKEFREMPITQNKILFEIATYYLEN